MGLSGSTFRECLGHAFVPRRSQKVNHSLTEPEADDSGLLGIVEILGLAVLNCTQQTTRIPWREG